MRERVAGLAVDEGGVILAIGNHLACPPWACSAACGCANATLAAASGPMAATTKAVTIRFIGHLPMTGERFGRECG
jgi:hypothetical protein